MLLESELDSYVTNPDSFVPIIAERLRQYRAAVRDRTAIHHRRGAAAVTGLATPFPAAAPGGPTRRTSSRGMGGSAGQYQGTARVVLDLESAMTLEPGEVMVAPLTDAAWTPLFLVVGAVVVDVGASTATRWLYRGRSAFRACALDDAAPC